MLQRDLSDRQRKYFRKEASIPDTSSSEVSGLDKINKQDAIRLTAINYACGRETEKDIIKAEAWLAKLDKNDENSARIEIVLKNDFVTALKYYKKAATLKKLGHQIRQQSSLCQSSVTFTT